MTDTTGTRESQADSKDRPQVGTASSSQVEGAQKAQAAGAADESGTVDPAQLHRENGELRREAAGYRKRLKDAEEQLSALQARDLSEVDKLKRRVADYERLEADWERERQESRLRESAINHAATMGFRKPADAYRFIDLAKVDFDEHGAPTNVEKLLTELLTDYPGLGSATAAIGTSDAGRRSTPEGSGQPGMNELLRIAAGKG